MKKNLAKIVAIAMVFQLCVHSICFASPSDDLQLATSAQGGFGGAGGCVPHLQLATNYYYVQWLNPDKEEDLASLYQFARSACQDSEELSQLEDANRANWNLSTTLQSYFNASTLYYHPGSLDVALYGAYKFTRYGSGPIEKSQMVSIIFVSAIPNNTLYFETLGKSEGSLFSGLNLAFMSQKSNPLDPRCNGTTIDRIMFQTGYCPYPGGKTLAAYYKNWLRDGLWEKAIDTGNGSVLVCDRDGQNTTCTQNVNGMLVSVHGIGYTIPSPDNMGVYFGTAVGIGLTAVAIFAFFCRS